MNIKLKWYNRKPKSITDSLQHISKLIEKGFNCGERNELEVDENGKEEELRGWWSIE